MAAQTTRGIPLSAVCPRYLHTNSTSHTGPFSAIAELIDNAYDPDVSAKQFWIDKTVIKGQDCLIFMDNGNGMDYDKMHKMLSFGFSDKQTVKGHAPVGLYGNGFKSGSMRLGKDAIVFSKQADTMCVGLLSQTYLERTGAKNVIVPVVKFTNAEHTSVAREYEECLHDILTYSLFNIKEELLIEFQAINGPCGVDSSGTRIIIWNLHKTSSGELEFDFMKDRYDIRLPIDINDCSKESNKGPEIEISPPQSEYSLRAYTSILYLKPRMQIIVCGKKVKTQLVSKSLAHIIKDTYKPTFLKKGIKITFGYNTGNKEHYGLMMYYKNRLIKAYEPVACQRKANKTGVGVIGVIECNYLNPMHNKQDFEKTEEYRKTIQNVSTKLEEYWKEIRHRRNKIHCTVPVEDDVKKPDQNWVQCDECMRWRKLPDCIDVLCLPEKWFCRMNPDPQFRSCAVEEEPEDSDDEAPRNQKTYKQDEKNQKLQKEKNRQQVEQEQEGARVELILALAKENADVSKKQKDLRLQLKLGSPVQGTPTSPSQRHAGSTSGQVPTTHYTPTSASKKRPMGLSQENGKMKRARIGDRFDSSTPSRPSTSTASSEFCSLPILDNSDGDGDQAAWKDNEALSHVSIRHVSVGTQSQQKPVVKREVGDTERVEKEKGNKDGENDGNCFESEKDFPPVERNTNKELMRNEEIRAQQKSVPSQEEENQERNMSNSTVQSEGELNHRENSDEIRRGDQTSAKLKNSVLDVMEAQEQQDKLLELLEGVTNERDESHAQLLILNSQVEELRSQLLELTQKTLKKEHSQKYTQTSPEETQDNKVLYLQCKEEIKKLQEELIGLKLEKEERERKGQQSVLDDDEMACQIDLLLKEIDSRNKEREELKLKVDSLEKDNCTLSTSCDSLKKDLEELKREIEKVKVCAEDQEVQTDFPVCSHKESTAASAEASNSIRGRDFGTQQHETQDRSETYNLKLRELRQTVARLLVTWVPGLDLQQVNYDCDVIDEILTQVVNESSAAEAAST
ncbi:MORC family CW-type zinc finger protein 3-like [Hemibagrus wyckioides]|uniref:MORC family CW-type zinc finger protein 3-like n=1 Tax=Hemibagrus wyckioides TaxID=337641 RepID=UPI00266B780F|nr:MORC family CW-type zinc finger protein 3-like [Hemibagrus wyckioides]